MSIKNKFFKYLFSVGIISSVLFTSVSTYSVADSSVSSETGYNVDLSADLEVSEEEYANMVDFIYPGKEFFDPLDASSLLDEKTIRVNELADEDYWYGNRDTAKCRVEYEKAARSILAKIDPSWSDFRKLLYLHDYICMNTDYDRTSTDMIKQTAYGCLVLHKCVCDGYARAFYDLANRAGIETYYVLSMGMDHAWNVSKVDGKFYYIDCTWDGKNMSTINGVPSIYISHSYFLKSESYMNTHLHNYSDITIPAYATVDGSTDLNIYGKYNNTEYDDALFTRISGPVYTVGNTDRYYIQNPDFYSNIGSVCIADNNTIVETISFDDGQDALTYIGHFVIRGNKIYLIQGSKLYSGTLTSGTTTLTLLVQAPVADSYDDIYIKFDNLRIEGTKIVYDEVTYDNSLSLNLLGIQCKSIDISEDISNTVDYFSTEGPSFVDYSGSPARIEGYNCRWNEVDGKSYWYENSVKQGTYDDPKGVIGDNTVRGREIYDSASDGWYWLDSVYFGAKAVNKEVWIPYIYQDEKNCNDDSMRARAAESDGGLGGVGNCVYEAMKNKSGKWVRYDQNGKMFKGWVTIEGELAARYPDQAGNTYYYDTKTGLMAKGVVQIGGQTYVFDGITGALKK